MYIKPRVPTLFLILLTALAATDLYAEMVTAPPDPCDENFDGVTIPALPSGWSSTASGAETIWVTSATSSDTAPNAAFAPDPADLGETFLFSPVFRVASNGGQFSFRNLYNLEAAANSPDLGFDGMVLEISINSGPFQDIVTAGGSFVTGGYNRTIVYGFNSPITLRSAWSGLSGGTTTNPAYITTTVNLPPSANGQNIQLRWRVATDGSLSAPGSAGVRIDTITGIPCQSGTPIPTPTPTGPPSLGNYPVTSIPLSTNIVVEPDALPVNTSRMNVFTDTSFKGTLAADPTTGSVRVTDAHPAGTYTVAVKASNGVGVSVTKTFSMTVTTPATCNPPTFTTASSGGGSYPTSVAVGDLNNDGKQDIVTTNQTINNVSLRIGNGDGTFGAPAYFATGTEPYAVAIGDFNGDGDKDLAVANYRTATVSVLLGNGAGGFGNAANFVVGSFPYSVAVGDLNNDGNQDLAIANSESANVSILLGNGDGSFGAATNFGAGTRPHSVAIGDFNGDGNKDLAIANYNSHNASVLLGIGNGSFGAATNLDVGNNPDSIAIGDFNADGKQDFVTANYDFNRSNNVSVRLGNGDGSFGSLTNFTTGESTHGVAIGDFNGDGKQDLAVANGFPSILTILLGNGAGGFNFAGNFGSGIGGESEVAVGDFNADGRQDLALVTFYQESVSIFQRFCGPTPTVTATPDTVSVTIPYVQSYGSSAVVPINVGDVTDLGITHYEMAISYTKGAGFGSFNTSGTLSDGWTVSTSTSSFGQLVISATGTTPLTGSGPLINTTWWGYEPSPNHGSTLGFGAYIDPSHNYHPAFRFNDGSPPVALTNGGVAFFVSTPTNTATPTPTPTNTATPGGTPATWIVTKTTDTNDSVCDADCSLREAIGAVIGGDTVAFSPLFDSPQIIRLTLGQLIINTPVTISGPGPNLLTVSANFQGRVFNVWGNIPNVTISGMKLRDGNVGTDPATAVGGAILVENGNGTLNISNVEFTNNKAYFAATPYPYGAGTAAFCYGCTMNLDNVNAHHNGDTGCAIEAYGPLLNISNSTISYNACGVYSTPSLNMQNTTVQGNTNYGIGSYNLTLVNSQILGNTGRGVFGGNGQDTVVSVENSVIAGNWGGLDTNSVTTVRNSQIRDNLYYSGLYGVGTTSVIDSAITGNGEVSDGGGIYNYGLLYLTNSTVSGNFAGYNNASSKGGGIYQSGGLLVLTNSTISNNRANGSGGGVAIGNGASTVGNSIIGGNTSVNTSAPDVSGSFFSIGYNLVGVTNGSSGWRTSDDLLNVNPMLGTLADNGGPTKTHALLPGSPAINAGNNAWAVNPQTQMPLTGDQRGFQRFAGTVDIGAYERQPTIAGIVTYGNAIGSPTPRFVSGVLLTAVGSPNVTTTTSVNGTYTLGGFGSGVYTVTPSKTGDINGAITSFDSARIAQHASGLNPLTGNQLIVADVSGNGTVSSFDSAQIARYAAGLDNHGSTGTWMFIPANRTYSSVNTNITGEDFIALLMGEVSGNWMSVSAIQKNLSEK